MPIKDLLRVPKNLKTCWISVTVPFAKRILLATGLGILAGFLLKSPFTLIVLAIWLLLSFGQGGESPLIYLLFIYQGAKNAKSKRSKQLITGADVAVPIWGFGMGTMIAFIVSVVLWNTTDYSMMSRVLCFLPVGVLLVFFGLGGKISIQNKVVQTAVCFLLCLGGAYLKTMIVHADDGGWTESGRNIAGWLANPGTHLMAAAGVGGPAGMIAGWLGNMVSGAALDHVTGGLGSAVAGTAAGAMDGSLLGLWIGTMEGAAYLKPERGTWNVKEVLTSENGLSDDCVNVIFKAEGQLWFGTYLASGKGGCSIRNHSGEWSYLSIDEGLPHRYINAILPVSEQELLIATGHLNLGGLARVKRQDGGEWLITDVWNREDGIPGDKVRWLFLDQEQRLWITTESNGMLLCPQLDCLQSPIVSSLVITVKNGLSDNEIKVIVECDDCIWLGSRMGLTRVDKGYVDQWFENYITDNANK